MADNPEGPMPNRNEEDCSQLMGNVSQKQLVASSVPDSQHPDLFNPAAMKEEVLSVTLLADASSGEHSSPVSETLSPHDIDCFIGSVDLKSEEITSLMAEKVPSSDSDDSYGKWPLLEEVPSVTVRADASSGEHSSPVSETLSPLDIYRFIGSFDLKSEEITSLMAEKVPSSDSDDSHENKDAPQYLEEDVKKLASELAGKVKLDEDTMKSWLADGSDDSAMSSCREPLIPLDDESDMEEFNYNKEHAKSETNINIEKEEPFVDDLISLKESGEKILEAALNNTVDESENNLDTDNESVLDLTAIGNKSLLDIEIEELQNLTTVVNNHILDTELETSQNQVAESNKSLLDIELETSQNQAAVSNKSLLDTELETSQNQAAVSNKSLMDTELETSQNQAAVSNKNLLDTDLEALQNLSDVANKSLLDTELETLQNPSDVANKSTLDVQCEGVSTEGKQDSNSDIESCARICIDHIKSALTDILKEVKKSDPKPATISVDPANGNGLKTLEEKLREEAEVNSTKKNVPQWDGEMGLPKVNVPDSLRIIKDENFKKNIKKVGVYINKLKIHSDDISNEINLKKEDDEMFQSDKADEMPQETFHGMDSVECKDAVSNQEESPLNCIEENSLHNETIAEFKRQGSAETNIVNESLRERHSLEKTTEDTLNETLAEKKVETDNAVQETKTAVIKSILKKHVSFASTRGHPGMEHMALHHEETKIEEKQLDMETPLRFLTETYPSHEDEEMLSESLNATLEPGAFPRTRRESPRAAELYEELKILEGEDQPKTISCSPCPSPDRPDFPDSAIKDNKTATNKSGKKFSKFFKSFKKKIWN